MPSLFANYEVNSHPFWPKIGRLVAASLAVHTGVMALVLYVPAFRAAFNIAFLFSGADFVSRDYKRTEIGDDVQIVDLTTEKFRYPDGYFAPDPFATAALPVDPAGATIVSQANFRSSAVATPTPEPSPSPTPAASPATPESGPQSIRTWRYVESPPRRIFAVAPTYPTLAKRQNLTGRVTLAVVVLPDGTVAEEPRIVSALPAGRGFERAAADAVRQWRFEPATRDGKPVAANLTVAVDFK